LGLLPNILISELAIDKQKEITTRLEVINKKIGSELNYLSKQQQIKAGLMNDLLSGKKQVVINKELAP
jgi:hypothetical protein